MSRTAIIVTLVIASGMCLVVFLIAAHAKEGRRTKAAAMLHAMLDEAITQADRDAASFHFDSALASLNEAQQILDKSAYGYIVKERLDEAIARTRGYKEEHVKKLEEGYIFYGGKLIPGPPVKLVVGEAISETFRCLGQLSSRADARLPIVIENSVLYCRYIQVTPSGKQDWEYEVWPLHPGELLIRLREKEIMKDSGSLNAVQLPEFAGALWVDQSYEIRDRADKVVYRFPPETSGKTTGKGRPRRTYIAARVIDLSSLCDLLEYPLAQGSLKLRSGGSMGGVSCAVAEQRFAGSLAVAITFENRTSP